MSLQALVNNADCGPSTGLQGLSKQFERDRGAQNDLFARPGSSRETFRSPQAPISADHAQEAAQFFGRAPSTSQRGPPSQLLSRPFDVHALRDALPAVPGQHQQPQQLPVAPVADWAADFLSAAGPSFSTAGPAGGTLRTQPQPFAGVSGKHARARAYAAALPFQVLQRPQDSGKGKARADEHAQWEREFSRALEQTSQQQHPQIDADELSRTAGVLLDAVKTDTSEKFAQSEFLGFMRQLRDRELVVDGDRVVERAAQAESAGQGATRSPPGVTLTPQSVGVGLVGIMHENRTGQPHAQHEQESQLDRELAQDNVDFMRYWADARTETLSRPVQPSAGWVDPLTGQWDMLQREWDAFEATAAGVRPVSPAYAFQADNPYLRGESSQSLRHRHHAMHGASAREFQQAAYASVLEKEAAVQREPGNARAWYDLGVRLQESDREIEAMRALRRAVEIEPDMLPAWMALAVSYSNEGRRTDSLSALQQWVRGRGGREIPAKVDALVDGLLALVQETAGADELDADVQMALAVLFHTTEDYPKALDCFRAALAARPQDALLYNRVGATLANSGRSDEALAYYRHALELSPAYVRAEFNTGIALVNMGRLEDGARHLIAALALQQTETATPPPSSSGQMWDLLRSCLIRMNRMDLVTFCDARNLAGIQADFGAGDPMSV
ncbi:TPR-like protein [Auricularia subglabra TFB-10046 SS5]|uniref:TPR-like protein n=1 Tax=Auricularia subglabra (strain TFB-10046 / SS5) TaxID=717982 RepID=J0WRH2_AURST|nr:TPR-like protein [Auricularia subglabra TFB-10046 SS5]